jgi:heptaprenyl diphosphate synthase
MYMLRRLLGSGRISFIGLGTTGAMVSNAAQLALARIFIFGNSVMYIAPPFMAAGLVTGTVLGAFCETFARRSQWYAKRKIR